MGSFDYITGILEDTLSKTETRTIRGRVIQVTGTIIRAMVPAARVGEICILSDSQNKLNLQAEVVGFSTGAALLTPIGDMQGVSSITEVIPTGKLHSVPVGRGLLGRVLDGMGNPFDGKGHIEAEEYYPVYADAPEPMSRKIISKPMPLGIKSIDGLLTLGEGQRVGIFAAAGGGKSTLMGSIVHGAQADVIVIALIGERGREVREFIEHNLGEEGMRRSIVVCATSERSSMERAKAAFVATSISEYFRNQGSKVLLLMDSVTRFARALREIGLSAGEPPTRRGFPPSVFATLPRLMERVGNNDKGSISALYTVLVEGDDMNEPVADETRSILDGHIILSRKLAEQNHYPAIDVLASVSRIMPNIVDKSHMKNAARIRELMAKYVQVELLLKIGEYKSGSDALTDEAIEKRAAIEAFLRQSTRETANFEDSVAIMEEIAR